MAYTMTHILIAEKVLEDIKMPVDYSTYIVHVLTDVCSCRQIFAPFYHSISKPSISKESFIISEMCHKTDEPIYVTKNGYGDMVIMSMEIYKSTMRQIAMYRDIEISEKQVEAGKVRDARIALSETRVKYGL